MERCGSVIIAICNCRGMQSGANLVKDALSEDDGESDRDVHRSIEQSRLRYLHRPDSGSPHNSRQTNTRSQPDTYLGQVSCHSIAHSLQGLEEG